MARHCPLWHQRINEQKALLRSRETGFSVCSTQRNWISSPISHVRNNSTSVYVFSNMKWNPLF